MEQTKLWLAIINEQNESQKKNSYKQTNSTDIKYLRCV